MNINLYIDFYFDKNPERAAELEDCLRLNVENSLIDNIVLYIDKRDTDRAIHFFQQKFFSVEAREKIYLCYEADRPTYNDIFVAMNHVTGSSDINIIANADIYFDQASLQRIKDFRWDNHCMALTRWDESPIKKEFDHPFVNPYPEIYFYDHADSQDAWVFKGYTEHIPGADFTMGVPGCDNRIAYLLSQAGFKVINPSRTIKIIHKHKSTIRNYNRKQTVKPPYLTLQPTNL